MPLIRLRLILNPTFSITKRFVLYCQYLKKIIRNNFFSLKVHRFQTIAEHYTMLLAEFGFDADELARERKNKFLCKLEARYGERLRVIRHPTSGVGKVLYASSLPAEKAIVTTFDLKVNLTVKVKGQVNCKSPSF
jgi:hypothetical protein